MEKAKSGRELDVDQLMNSKTKVTLGFKCDPSLKLALALKAEKYGLSLSEYVELLISTSKDGPSKSSSTDHSFEIISLRKKIAFYENDMLKSAFQQYKGKFINLGKGPSEKKIVITTIEDMYTAIIESQLNRKTNV
jgi:hypothetical protein